MIIKSLFTTKHFAIIVGTLGLASFLTGRSPAATFDFTASQTIDDLFITNDFTLWMPDNSDSTTGGTRRVNGLVMVLPSNGRDARHLAENGNFQRAAEAMGFGLLAAGTSNFRGWGDFDPDFIQTVFDSAAEATGRSELSNAPVSLIGWSRGGSVSAQIAQAIPDRVISHVNIKGTAFATPPTVPSLHIAGSLDTTVPPGGITGNVTDYARRGLPVASVIDWQTGHAPEENQGFEAGWFWMGELARLRLGENPRPLSAVPGNTPQLIDIAFEDGWLGQRNTFASGEPVAPSSFAEIAPVVDGTFSSMRPSEASWLPSEAAALVYRAFTSTDELGLTQDARSVRTADPLQGPLKILIPQLTSDRRIFTPLIDRDRFRDRPKVITISVDPRDWLTDLTSLDFYVNENLVGTDSSGDDGWSHRIPIPEPGIHAVVVVGRDALGNQTSSFRTILVTGIVPEPSTLALMISIVAVGSLTHRRSR